MGNGLVQSVGADRVLETSRCLLRHPDGSDVPRALSAFTSPSFPREVPLGQLGSAEEVEAWIAGAQERWADGSAYTWTVIRRSDGLLVGQVSLATMPKPGQLSLAFWSHPDSWGEGFATEAARRIVAFAFSELGADVVWAGAARWNVGSRRVLQKIGMAYVSDNARGYVVEGRPIRTKEFEITRDMWLRRGTGPDRGERGGR